MLTPSSEREPGAPFIGQAEHLAALVGGAVLVREAVGAVWLRGPDARRFANGMFTNNVRDLPVGAVNRHAIVDDRGRVGGFLELLCVAEDAFLAVLDGIGPAAFCERYDPYVVFDDVELESTEGALTSVVLVGASAEAVATEAGLALPGVEPAGTGQPYAEAHGGYAYRTWGWPGAGVRWVVPEAGASAIVGALGLAEADPAVLQVARLLAGVPRYPEDTGEKGLPHELGLREQLLSFEKGCYLGQESINRIDVMGNVRKKLRVLRFDGAPPEAGSEVELEGTRVGRLTSPVQLPGGGGLALAVLKEPAHAAGATVTAGGRPAQVGELPLGTEAVPRPVPRPVPRSVPR